MGWILSKCCYCCGGDQEPELAAEPPVAAEPQIPEAVPLLALPPVDYAPEIEPAPEEEIDWDTVNNETAMLAIKHLYTIVSEQLRIDIQDLFIAELIDDTQYQQLPRLYKYEGPTAMNTKLLEYILEGQQAKLFVQNLKEWDSNVYQQLVPVILRVQRGEVTVYGSAMEGE